LGSGTTSNAGGNGGLFSAALAAVLAFAGTAAATAMTPQQGGAVTGGSAAVMPPAPQAPHNSMTAAVVAAAALTAPQAAGGVIPRQPAQKSKSKKSKAKKQQGAGGKGLGAPGRSAQPTDGQGQAADVSAEDQQHNTEAAAGGTSRKSRENLPKDSVRIMKRWLFQHITHPYPTEADKTALMQVGAPTMQRVTISGLIMRLIATARADLCAACVSVLTCWLVQRHTIL
jgi:hypothetical protein